MSANQPPEARGSAGYFCAGLTDAARFEVDNNVGWGVGDNMYSGRVVVRGNAGAIPGVAIYRSDRRARGDRAPPGHRDCADGRDPRRGRRGQGVVPVRPRPVPGRLPDRHRCAFLHRPHLGRELRGCVRGDHLHQPLQLHLRAGMRRALRARLPACRQRRGGADPEPEALRDGQARGDVPPARGAGHAEAEHRHRGRGPGRAGGGARSLRRRLRGARLRDDGPPRSMARTDPRDAPKLKAMLDRRLRLRENPFPQERPACLDDLVFLPANLSRLVIDPYREACEIGWRLGGRLDLDIPFFVAGFDTASEELKVAVDRGVVAAAPPTWGRPARVRTPRGCSSASRDATLRVTTAQESSPATRRRAQAHDGDRRQRLRRLRRNAGRSAHRARRRDNRGGLDDQEGCTRRCLDSEPGAARDLQGLEASAEGVRNLDVSPAIDP